MLVQAFSEVKIEMLKKSRFCSLVKFHGQMGCSYWSEQRAGPWVAILLNLAKLVLNYPRQLDACWRQLWYNEYGYFLCGLQLYESTEDRS